MIYTLDRRRSKLYRNNTNQSRDQTGNTQQRKIPHPNDSQEPRQQFRNSAPGPRSDAFINSLARIVELIQPSSRPDAFPERLVPQTPHQSCRSTRSLKKNNLASTSAPGRPVYLGNRASRDTVWRLVVRYSRRPALFPVARTRSSQRGNSLPQF